MLCWIYALLAEMSSGLESAMESLSVHGDRIQGTVEAWDRVGVEKVVIFLCSVLLYRFVFMC